ncbi:6-phosphofructo-2-kinase / fructose-2 6-bisphosphatase [Fasciola hepatica]|uniref:6-phosphofructo-2-kinase / fructose-2 6-bisphosphatase n=1 Tax=Fasciola hepatica TaxID=6192 RepID=A0A4E0RXI9_FASHE|nr:6-phosphofructo-2-kinase / fructose-2 6-bisphosphatase [Fasciola hepatica]
MSRDRRISLNYSPLSNCAIPILGSYRKEGKTVVVLVGLPARGKSYIATKLTRYLNWVGITTRVFNVGVYRRRHFQAQQGHDFFCDDNEDAKQSRHKIAEEALEDMISWLVSDQGDIGVFDATNTTRERRLWIMEKCKSRHLDVLFVESICSDPKVIEENVLEVKVNSPDYVGMDKEKAMEDFMKRMHHYEAQYVPIDDDLDKDWSYIKIFNQGQRYLANHIEGNVNSRIAYYLMNIRVRKRTIYLTRHGETDLNLAGKIGGDASLSPRGREFAMELAKFMSQENLKDLKVWTSHLKRTIETAELVPCTSIAHWKALDELDAGVCDGMTYREIQEKYPADFARRDADKYHYRYPMGESYEDLVGRLEPVIMELERQTSVLVICHQAVARCLLAYFEDKNQDELPYLRVPLHTVFKLTPVAYRCIVERVQLQVPAVDTHRPKPLNIEPNRTSFEALQTVPPFY